MAGVRNPGGKRAIMKIHTLGKRQFVPAPLERVFGFFSRPENLSKLTPPGLGFVILTPSPIEMKPGALIDYTIRLFGFRVRWKTLITAYEPGRFFVDEQLRGPYSFWHHSHFFGEAPGGTIVRDEVRYALPLGPLGELAHSLVVKRQLRAIFSYRERVIGEYFGGKNGHGGMERVSAPADRRTDAAEEKQVSGGVPS
jgi:ligand-binding SRPBCC domain-containing protein